MDTKEILTKWVNGEISLDEATALLETEMPYGVITGDEGTPEEWMEQQATWLGIE